jgi:hypothetical protein
MTGVWVDDRFVALGGSGMIKLVSVGNWYERFRPTICAVTLVTTEFTLVEELCWVNWWQGGDSVVASGVCTFWVANKSNDCDVYSLEMWGPSVYDFQVTNVQFYG